MAVSATMVYSSVASAVFYWFLWTTHKCGAFNLASQHAHVIVDPKGQVGSYFGFTVALRKQSDIGVENS
nr:unnamed protein product [Timema cristinae]